MNDSRTRSGYPLVPQAAMRIDTDLDSTSAVPQFRHEMPVRRVFAHSTSARDTIVARQLGERVVAALIDEVTLTPKPGLVDIRGNGAHRDLSWALMCTSAVALQPAFSAMAHAGLSMLDDRALREAIGAIGRDAETAMFAVTRGVNTHRGAIWALGLLVTAAAQDLDHLSADQIAARAGALARLPDSHAPLTTGNKGEQACRDYEVGGARGQAQAGFPHVTQIALPELHRSRLAGGTGALHELQERARDTLALGGAASLDGRRALKMLDGRLLALNVSPGGAADLLAATLFLDSLSALHSGFDFTEKD